MIVLRRVLIFLKTGKDPKHPEMEKRLETCLNELKQLNGKKPNARRT